MLTKLAVSGLMTVMALLAVASQSGRALAQYPVPEGSCAIKTSATNTDPGGSVGVTVTVLDVNGKPVPGTAVDLAISKQPGQGASLSGNAAATDGLGMVNASLGAGGTGGVIGLSAHTSAVSCSGSVVVGDGAVLAAVELPDTGSGSSRGDSPEIFAAFLLGALGVVSVAWAMTRRSARRG